jgi:SAM-dependent methyltransferase
MDEAEQSLLTEVETMCANARCRQVVLAHGQGLAPSVTAERFNATIHPRDQMLLHSLHQHRDAGAAFTQYFGIALQQYDAARQIMQSMFGVDARDIEVLDFACGYGRLLRFLSLAAPPERLWASELQSDAVAFVGSAFGVRTLASHADPAQFEPGRRFDFIWVASLFSHLPATLFDAWLAKLISLLSPRGVLCFSVRDVALLPAGAASPEGGLVYSGDSENADLGSDIYGTTYADENRVRRSLHKATGDARPLHRLRRALANEQDLYVVAADAQRDLSALQAFRRGPWGWLDRRSLSNRGTLVLEGWAASLDEGVVEDVEIEIEGKLTHRATGIQRPDVSAAFDDVRLGHSGWRFECELGDDVAEAFVVVSARTRRGERALLYVGTVRAQP